MTFSGWVLFRSLNWDRWLFLLAVVLPLVGSGQQIQGVVVDTDNQPIPGATILVYNPTDSTVLIVPSSGEWQVPQVLAAPWTVEVFAVGFFTRILTFDTLPSSPLRVVLTANDIALKAVEIRGVKPVGAYQAIGPELLALLQPIGVQEALQNIPGVVGVTDDGMGNSRINIGIRGLNPRRTSRVLVLEDGVPIQPALYVYSNMYYNPPVERMERMEVLKGSSNIQYGPHTMGGVVNYITARPRSAFGGRVLMTTGINNYLSSLVEVGGLGGEKVKIESQLLYKQGDGFRENNGFFQFNGTLKVLLLPSADRHIYINANSNYENSNATYTGLTEYVYANTPRFNPKEHDNFEVIRHSLSVFDVKALGENLTQKTTLYLNHFDRDWWRELDVFVSAADYDNGVINPLSLEETVGVDDLLRVGNGTSNFGIIRRFNVAGLQRSYTLNHAGIAGNSATTVGGVRLHFEDFSDQAGNGDSPTARRAVLYRDNRYRTYALSGFAESTLALGPDLSVRLGARAEWFRQERVNRLGNDSQQESMLFEVLPSVGLNYVIPGGELFFNVSKGMTPPSNGTLLTLDFGDTDGTTFADVDFGPETSWTQEAGMRYTQGWMGGELTLFSTTIENMITVARGTVFTTLDKITSQGLELAATADFTQLKPWLPEVRLVYTGMVTEIHEGTIPVSLLNGGDPADVSGNALPYAPNHVFSWMATFRIDDTWSFNFQHTTLDTHFSDIENVTFISNRGDTGPIPGYCVYNAAVSYRPKPGWTVTCAAKNLLDTVYIGSRLHSNPTRQGAASSSGILPGPRRQVNLVVAYAF